MEVFTYGPYIIGRDLDLIHAFYTAQCLWDKFLEGDEIHIKDDTDCISFIPKNSKYPCILFEYDPVFDKFYKIGMYSSYRGAIKAFSRRASALRNCHYRSDLQAKYSDIHFLIWDAKNGSLLKYRHYYGHNTRIFVDSTRYEI